VITAFGGNDEAPIAERTSESTTTIRTNEVVITRTNGERERRQRDERVERKFGPHGVPGE
jgi:hypothetical protein